MNDFQTEQKEQLEPFVLEDLQSPDQCDKENQPVAETKISIKDLLSNNTNI